MKFPQSDATSGMEGDWNGSVTYHEMPEPMHCCLFELAVYIIVFGSRLAIAALTLEHV